MVAVRNGLKIGTLGSTTNFKGKGIPVSAVLFTKDKILVLGFEDGMVTVEGKDFFQSSSKVTGICKASNGDLWISNKNGEIINIEKVSNGKFQIPCKTYEQALNLKAHRLLIVSAPDNIEILVVSGENGEIYSAPIDSLDLYSSFEDQFVKASDNPHHMSLIQFLSAENY